ncbi:MAG TPA: hypothetical protein PK160_03000 [Bacillota bacterium]|nr:hypothetical protein [Bacillota bacterium]
MKEKRIKDKKEIMIYDVFAKLLMFLAVLSIFFTFLLDNSQPDSDWVIYGIISFVVLNIASLALANIIKADKEIQRLERTKVDYDKLELTESSYEEIDDIKNGLIKNKYELLSNGYYHKRIAVQSLCLYAKFLKTDSLEDVVAKESVRFKKFLESNCQMINAILFIRSTHVKTEDLDFVKRLSRDFLLSELLPIKTNKVVVIVVLLDEANKKAYYLEAPDSYSTKIYSYGSINLRKIFKK